MHDIKVDVVIGLGYFDKGRLSEQIGFFGDSRINLVKGTARISEYMCKADLAITSGGRTVLELAALHIPTIVVCQNDRETTHTFASLENGIVNLGHHQKVDDTTLYSTILSLLESPEKLEGMKEKSCGQDLSTGKKRVIQLIKKLFVNND